MKAIQRSNTPPRLNQQTRESEDERDASAASVASAAPKANLRTLTETSMEDDSGDEADQDIADGYLLVLAECISDLEKWTDASTEKVCLSPFVADSLLRKDFANVYAEFERRSGRLGLALQALTKV